MPDPVKAPPKSLVDETKTKVLLEVHDKFKDLPSRGFEELHKRDNKMIEYLIEELANLRAFCIFNEIKIP